MNVAAAPVRGSRLRNRRLVCCRWEHQLSPQPFCHGFGFGESSLSVLRCASNQSAMIDVSLSRSGQPCSAPFLTTSLVSTPDALSLSRMSSACWIGTSLIGIAVDDQSGRIVGRGMVNRADLAADLEDLVQVGDPDERLGVRVLLVEVEGGFESLQHAATDRDLTGLAVVEKIGGWKEAADRLDPAGGLVDGVLGVLVTGVAGRSLHERQVPSGRSAGDPDPVRVDVIVLRMVPDEAHGPVHVLDDLGNCEPGLAAVDDGKDSVPAIEQLADESRVDRLMRREPPAADHPDDAAPLALALGVKTSIVSAVPNLRP